MKHECEKEKLCCSLKKNTHTQVGCFGKYDKCVKRELPNKIPILVWVRRFSKVDKIIQI